MLDTNQVHDTEYTTEHDSYLSLPLSSSSSIRSSQSSFRYYCALSAFPCHLPLGPLLATDGHVTFNVRNYIGAFSLSHTHFLSPSLSYFFNTLTNISFFLKHVLKDRIHYSSGLSAGRNNFSVSAVMKNLKHS